MVEWSSGTVVEVPKTGMNKKSLIQKHNSKAKKIFVSFLGGFLMIFFR